MVPTPGWDDELWKDGLGNIDEQHNHVENETQRWFVGQTRLGVPVDFTNEGGRGLAHHRATSLPSQIGQASTWNVDLVHQIACVAGRRSATPTCSRPSST